MRACLPRAFVVAGPNGSGKSTLIAQLRSQPDFAFPERYINADDMARDDKEGTQEDRERRAFHAARDLRRQYREQGVPHAFETVFSHPSGLLDLQRLRDTGFDVTFVFVTTSNPQINVARVARRVQTGGHDVPIDRIVDRWHRSLRFLPRAAEIAEHALIFDSSDETELAATVEAGRVAVTGSSEFIHERLIVPLRARTQERALLGREISETRLMPDEAAGVYEGFILAAGSHYALQQTSSRQVVRHDILLLTDTISASEGQNVRITYKDGYGTPEPL